MDCIYIVLFETLTFTHWWRQTTVVATAAPGQTYRSDQDRESWGIEPATFQLQMSFPTP